MHLQPATRDDLDLLEGFALSPERVRIAEGLGSYHVIVEDNRRIGFLCFDVLWGTLPFLEYIELDPAVRRGGFGRQAVLLWEAAMVERGFDLVIVSTGADSQAQHFWRKMGYVDCGALTVRNKAAEVFLQKPISVGEGA